MEGTLDALALRAREDVEAAVQELILETKCPICLDFFTNPRSAPCQHNFCEVRARCARRAHIGHATPPRTRARRARRAVRRLHAALPALRTRSCLAATTCAHAACACARVCARRKRRSASGSTSKTRTASARRAATLARTAAASVATTSSATLPALRSGLRTLSVLVAWRALALARRTIPGASAARRACVLLRALASASHRLVPGDGQ